LQTGHHGPNSRPDKYNQQLTYQHDLAVSHVVNIKKDHNEAKSTVMAHGL